MLTYNNNARFETMCQLLDLAQNECREIMGTENNLWYKIMESYVIASRLTAQKEGGSMNWLTIVKTAVALAPEIVALIEALTKAFGALPDEHKQAITAAARAVSDKQV